VNMTFIFMTFMTVLLSIESSKVHIVPVYWLNLDSMPERAASMSNHLKSQGIDYHKRVRGLTPESCNLLMYDCSCHRVSLNDIAILCSHVSGLYMALHDNSTYAANSKYFLMLEDDVRFRFRVDFNKLIELAPKGFGALQLMMSRKQNIESHWELYSSHSNFTNTRKLFTYRPRNSTVWSAQAILYNKDAIRKFIASAVSYDRNGMIGYKLVNTFDMKKVPTSHSNAVNKYNPAIYSDCIFADMFLYAMSHPTYILNVPFFNSAILGLNSSSHQAHVKHHVHGFSKLQEIQQSLLNGTFPLPSFMSPLSTTITEEKESIDWKEMADKNPISKKELLSLKIREG